MQTHWQLIEWAYEARQEYACVMRGGDLDKLRMQINPERAKKSLRVIQTPDRKELAAKMRRILGGDAKGR